MIGDRTFPRAMRLSGKLAFASVYDHAISQVKGPLKVFGKPNGLARARLGLSVSRRVGSAPVRNRIKRLLRETFRRMPRPAPIGYDLIIVVRPHEPLTLTEYQKLLDGLIAKTLTRFTKKEG